MPSIRIGTTFSRATAPTMPHMVLTFLRTLPAAPGRLRLLIQHQGLRRHVLPHGRAGPDRGTAADRHVVLDDRAMLVRAVIVTRDRARTDVHVASDGRVTDVAQMVRLAALAE